MYFILNILNLSKLFIKFIFVTAVDLTTHIAIIELKLRTDKTTPVWVNEADIGVYNYYANKLYGGSSSKIENILKDFLNNL